MQISQFAEAGYFEPRKFAAVLRAAAEGIAMTIGLGKDTLQGRDQIQSVRTQRRLREPAEVLELVEPRLGSELMARAWYRSRPLPGFNGQSAMQLVREGKAQRVLEFVDAVDVGVYAWRQSVFGIPDPGHRPCLEAAHRRGARSNRVPAAPIGRAPGGRSGRGALPCAGRVR